MRIFLPFLLILGFFISCKSDDAEMLEQKTNSYDVYVSGKENNQFCYWKNGIKHNIATNSSESNPSKVFVSGNEVYIKGRYGYWKNGNYTTYYQAAGMTSSDVIDIFDFYVKGGNIYFVGYTWQPTNPAPDKYEFCFWKNGVKTLLFKDTFTYNDNCTITEFNSDVYVGAQKKLSGNTNQGYFKNTTFYPITTSSQNFTEIISNENNVYFTSFNFYKNLITGVQTSFTPTPTTGGYLPALDLNDVYINGRTGIYYKNSNLIYSSSPSPIIRDLKVTDQNIYMVRSTLNNTEFKIYINNVETQAIQNTNFDSAFNNITVVKL
ncbi:hypothetical protein [Chryseobacterium paridis]|uniref:Uncharacterized protein n=1 Tax=Chryseobacterium paridis TaxID=2800328 RepID=A0ABS1FYM2_9FLAO|nr:hypothetical protein [Chryseobacterium paridis]MBK1897487.1 hypothetical protein [Chryseobacterium paridis]